VQQDRFDKKPASAADWSFRGKIAIRMVRNGVSDNTNLQILWRQKNQQSDVHLLGPFGQSVAHFFATDESIQYEIPAGSGLATAGNITEVERSLGWKLPLKEMKFWVRGLPVPELPHRIDFDDQGLPESLEQSSWKIDYRRFDNGSPTKTIFSRDSVRISLVIKEWRMNDG
jgi:outer membrane lipoprotein LolB